MKLRPIKFFFCFLICLLYLGQSQAQNFDSNLKEGKTHILKGAKNPNYLVAVKSLELAVKEEPNHAEANYFLGYAYSRLNYENSHFYSNAKSHLTLNASEQFEKVISLEKKYSGESAGLDPYSKLTQEWGVLALSFLNKTLNDSAIWALKEGKKRGAFSDFLLAYNKNILKNCSPGALLFTEGDNLFFNLLYLQHAESFRNDVTVVYLDLLNTNWYPAYVENNKGLDFGYSDSFRNEVKYIQWQDSMHVIMNMQTMTAFAWRISPSYLDNYILRRDVLLLGLLNQNQLKREVFFTNGIPNNEMLFLRNHFISMGVVNKLNVYYETDLSNQEFTGALGQFVTYLNLLNTNSQGELFFADDMRMVICGRIKNSLVANDIDFAKLLLKQMNEVIPTDKYPVFDETIMKFIENLTLQLANY